MQLAITRAVEDGIGKCELTHMAREPIDLALCRAQHEGYVRGLREGGMAVLTLPALPGHPDSVFVEDTAVVVDELAVLTHPGAASRRGEIEPMAQVLRNFRPTVRIDASETLEGGDVLRIGRHVWVGIGTRTTEGGVEQLRRHLEPLGYVVKGVRTTGCLHLKTGATAIGPEDVLVNPAWVDPAVFRGLRVHECDPGEPFGCNGLRVGGGVLMPAECVRTIARLEGKGFRVRGVEWTELAKAEGGLTCSSIVLKL